MRNKIRGAAALLCLAAGAVRAQTNVTIYGIVDSGVAYMTNVNANGDSMVKVPSLTGSLPSRLGFRGSEDLGNGLQAVFDLEGGILLDSGTTGQGNRLFGRQAWVGLKNQYGTLSLGRTYTMTYIGTLKSDVMGPNLFSLSSIDPYIANARQDNSVSYFGTYNGVQLGATYSTGRDTSAAGGPGGTNCPGEVAGDSHACRQETALLGYEASQFGVNATYDIMYGNKGAGGGLTSSGNSDKRITANAWGMLGATKIGGGVMDRRTAAATGLSNSDTWFLGVTQPLAPQLTLDAQVIYRDTKHSADDVSFVVARLTYAFSKRTVTYLNVGHIANKGAAAIALDAGGSVAQGGAQNGIDIGLRHVF